MISKICKLRLKVYLTEKVNFAQSWNGTEELKDLKNGHKGVRKLEKLKTKEILVKSLANSQDRCMGERSTISTRSGKIGSTYLGILEN